MMYECDCGVRYVSSAAVLQCAAANHGQPQQTAPPIRAQIIEIGDLEVKRSAFIHFGSEQDVREASKGRPIVLTWDVLSNDGSK